MNEYRPLHKNNLILKDLGDEFLIYSAENKEIHVINPTAQLIWNMCDGEHSMSDIEHEIQTHFSIPPDRDIKEDIQSTLNIFRDKGLLKNEAELG
jgi:hypothetical protein